MCRCVNSSYQFMKQSHFSWWMSAHITHGWFGYVKLLAQQIIYTVSQKTTHINQFLVIFAETLLREY